MDSKEIQQMFSEMGLGTPEQRDKIVRELSIKMDSHQESSIEIKIRNNTLKPEHYA